MRIAVLPERRPAVEQAGEFRDSDRAIRRHKGPLMAFRRDRSVYYMIRRRKLIGYGDTGQISSRTKNKKIAERMEQAIEDLADRALIEPRYRSLLDAVCRDHTLEPSELLASRHDLDLLLVTLTDPTMADAVDSFYKGFAVSYSLKIGLNQLLLYAPASARLSFLDAKMITTLCHKAMQAPEKEGGRQRNSVVRCLKRAVSQLIRFHLGNARRNVIFADVQFQAEDDTREVHLSQDQIRSLLLACHELNRQELAVIIRTALLTSADRAVLLAGPSQRRNVARGLLVRDVHIFWRMAATGAKSTSTTPRTSRGHEQVSIGHSLAVDLLMLSRGRNAGDPIFSIAYRDLDYPWKEARAKAGLKHVRFKDLRAQISQYGEEAGIPLTILQAAMGHSDDSMTRRYQQRQTLFTRDHADAIEESMGMSSLHLSLHPPNTDRASSL
ncbi:tyrosine-type recombinase/integrase [Rhodothermus sp. AH-315-K08]|nr:tyrosine-type recombinase/integrase [Rhodothermus sp. AH-315-K08]